MIQGTTVDRCKPALGASAEGDLSTLDRTGARLRRLIVQGQLGSGMPLIETDLAARLEIARGTVREALRRLESEGLVVARKRGLQVRRLSRADVIDLYDAREALEGLAARRAAERMRSGPPALARARLSAEKRLWNGVRSDFALAAFSEQNRGFHDLVVAASGNSHLARMLDQTLLALFAAQFRAWLGAATIATAAAEHVVILDAIAGGAAAEADRAMRSHVRRSAQTVLALPDAAFA